MLKKTLFNMVIYKGTMGALYGIVTGLILGLLIWTLLQVSITINGVIIPNPGDAGAIGYMGPPFEFFVTLGMCFGAVIGSIFGSLTALKEGKK
jgi:hypothetical protein